MKYTSVRIASFVVGSLMVLNSGTVNAGWGLLGGSGGSSGGGSSGYLPAAYAGSTGGSTGYSAAYASYGSTGGASSGGASSGGASFGGASTGGSVGTPGLMQRVHSRVHGHLAAKKSRHAARRAGQGSSGGSSGYMAYSASYGSSGGSVYSGGSSGGAVSYGSTGVSYGSTGAGYGSVGAAYYGASTSSSNAAASLVSNVDALSDAIYLTVNVPGNAKVFVNGNATTSTGAVRQYVSRGLESGKSYKFEIRAEVEGVDGKVMTEEKTIAIAAGEREQLQFAFADSDSTIQTAVTLNLPEGAQVILAGNTTKATGTQRTFRTSHLKPGQVWDDYEIEVKLGDEVKRQTVRLIAGDSLQLSFNFEDAPEAQLASR